MVDLRGPNCRGMSRGSATKCITSGMSPCPAVYSLFQPTTPREEPSVSDKLTYRRHCSSSFVRSFVVLNSGEKQGCDSLDVGFQIGVHFLFSRYLDEYCQVYSQRVTRNRCIIFFNVELFGTFVQCVSQFI